MYSVRQKQFPVYYYSNNFDYELILSFCFLMLCV